MGEAKAKHAKETEIDRQIAKLSPRFIDLAANMQSEGFDPIAIAEAQITVATAQMIVVRGPQRTAHALMMAAGGIAAVTDATEQPDTQATAH